jgi:hypothetical protein
MGVFKIVVSVFLLLLYVNGEEMITESYLPMGNQELLFLSNAFLEQTTSSYNQKVVNYVKSHAHAKSTGYCAKYVADAIISGGGNTKLERKGSATEYGQNLINAGYNKIGCSGLIAGDVVVIDKTSAHVYGHIDIKGDDGHYYSDFKQNSDCPYSDGCPSKRCYRHS